MPIAPLAPPPIIGDGGGGIIGCGIGGGGTELIAADIWTPPESLATA
jgi:hypothetical protein